MTSGSVGGRIAAYRRRRGLSQTALAGLVGRSESWLSQVERGIRSVDRLSVLLDLAKVLHVDVESLTGAPWQYAPNGVPSHNRLGEVRQFLSRYDNLLGIAPSEPSTLPELNQAVTTAHEAYQAARYEDVIADLPVLLSQADSLYRTAVDDRRDVVLGYSAAYQVAAKLLTKLGSGDLSMLAADRCASAAVEADSVAARGMAAYQVVCALLRSERPEDAEPLAVGMAEEAQRHARSDRPTLASVAGSLWLIAAVIASRRTDQAEAWRRLDQAQALAELLGQDGNFAWTAFGPTNVGIHRVSVAAELGDPATALRAAESVDLYRLPSGLKSRRAQMHLDLGWAEVQRKRDADAVLHLLEAERIAPESVRYNVIVGELVRSMLARQKRGGRTSALHNLAVRAGVLD
jgi:transcriptional regulator with XRE-family HTH domain